VNNRRARAGREGEIASPVEGVMAPATMSGEGANAIVAFRDSRVASTEEDSFS
jgi:hypothetical protein